MQPRWGSEGLDKGRYFDVDILEAVRARCSSVDHPKSDKVNAVTDQFQPAEEQTTASPPPSDDVMNIITGVQAELDRLKHAQEQQTSERTALEDLQQELDDREQSLADRQSQIDEREMTLADRETELARNQDELSDAQRTVENAGADLVQRAQEVESREAELARHNEALCAQQDDLNNELATLGAQREELDAASATLSEESAALAQRQARLQEHEHAFEESQSRRQQELDDRERELAAQRTGVEQADRNAHLLKEELEQRLEKLKTDQDEVECELDRLHTQRHVLVDTQTRLDDALTNAGEHIERLTEFESQVESLQAQLEESASQQERFQNQLIESSSKHEQLENDLHEARGDSSALQELLEEQAAAAVDPKTIAALEETIAAFEKTAAAHHGAVAELQAELDQNKDTIETLVEKNTDTDRLVQSLQAELEQAHAQLEKHADRPNSPFVALRRDRLGRVRKELRRRTNMISQAKDAIIAKSKEADHILAQRQEIAQAQIKLDSRAKKLETRAERSRGMSVLFLGVIAILGLGAASWTVVSRVVPATYIASATLAADDTSGALTSEQFDAWREYCTKLASDPRLMEIATDRMSRRGILEFANAATLSSKMSKDLDLASPAPGELTLSLTGVGADRTERILDTFVASLVSAANDAQQRRLDDASTVVAEKSTVDLHPINDPRLLKAAIVWGASVGVVLLLALGLWAKLSIALRKFDQENQEMLAAGGRPF